MDLWAASFDIAMRPLERQSFRAYRRWVVPKAKGALLEVGTGTGANIPFLRCDALSEIVLSDITLHHEALLTRLEKRCIIDAELVETPAEELPFPEGRFDTALATLVFCSVADQLKGLREIWRVLKPGGAFLFLEHVLPQKNHLSVPMKAINPLWRMAAGGCNLTRRTSESIESAGFTIEELRRDRQGILIAGLARR